MRYQFLCGDALERAYDFPMYRFDGILCDPPYGLNFMGRIWDRKVPGPEFWSAFLVVSKPGANLIAFGGTKYYHQLGWSIEQSGWEPRDQLMWLYGQGMPKTHNLSKAIDKKLKATRKVTGTQLLTGNAGVSTKDKGGTYGVQVGSASKVITLTSAGSPEAEVWEGYGTNLKPAWEPAMLAMAPLDGTYAENCLKWGTGGLAIDSSRVGATRWPSNLYLDSSAGETLDERMGNRPSHGGPSRFFAQADYIEEELRFFYCAKANTREREAGCEELPRVVNTEVVGREQGSVGILDGRSGAGRTGGARNDHPTLKPLALCKHYAGLILPPPRRDGQPRRLLVPFSGAGSEVIGALQAGWDEVVGIDLSPHYIDIAAARCKHWIGEP